MTEKLKGNAGKISPTRIDNLVAIINVMRDRPMSTVDIAALIGQCKSGVVRYTNELRDEKVIVVKEMTMGGRGIMNKPIYKLNPNKSIVMAYIDRINAIGVESRDRVQRRSDAKLHVMQDDEVFKVKRASDKIPAHHELMAFFFNIGNKEVAA